MPLSYNEKWQAVTQNDATYDGLFYYGVRSTGVFCRPSCKSKPPLQKNVQFFETITAASSDGFRPCKRCRPDLLIYQPNQELLKQVKDFYDAQYADPVALPLQSTHFPVSHAHLARLFKEQYGQTPNEYLNWLRAKKAADLLIHSQTSIQNIALDCGFGSLSSFYDWFKRRYGVSPNKYRQTGAPSLM